MIKILNFLIMIFLPNPVKDAKNLANIYYKKGYNEVEAKVDDSETFLKYNVNFIPVADITYLVPEIYIVN